MATKKNKTRRQEPGGTVSNEDWQGVDKDPEEEKRTAEKVTKEDLKGKKVDADPTLPPDKSLSRKK